MVVELHCHSNFSLLDGASHPEDLIDRAAELEMPALALTDHDNVYGAPRFAKAAERAGIHPIFGTEMTFTDGTHLTLLVQNQTGWANLCYLITQARHNAPKGEAALDPAHLADHTAGLIALSGCRHGAVSAAIHQKDYDAAIKAAQHYKNLFGDRYWIELQHHFSPHHDRLVDDLVDLADALHLRCVVTNNVHYARREDHERRDVLVSIRHNQSLDDVERSLFANSEYYLKTEKQLAPLFQDYPLALRNTHRIAEQCQFTLDYRLQDLPQIETPDGVSAQDYLRQLCTDALPYESSEQMTTQLEHELAVIQHSGLSNYFLVVWDIVRFAREHRILCQGRGSAANSLVAYLLGISPINPLAHNLVFERFLSAERQVVPDIDIDFQADRREEVIQYLYNKYGHNHAAMACTFVTFRSRSAIRDVGKALGIPPLWIELAAKSTERYEIPDDIAGLALVAEDTWTRLLDMVKQINRFPRHLGIHNGGMVIMGSPLSERIPTEPATMEDRYVVQWDKDDLEDMGLVKIDILGLRMLSLLAEAAQITGVDLEQIPAEDPKVYDLICAADTVGLFQVESRAQVSVLPRLQPRKFGDLIVSISLIRPGPIQGDMVHPYLRRRLGEEPIKYAHPLLKDALEETLGVILFQEQVLKLARNLAGFTAGQGELLRRALGSKDAAIRLKTFHEAFINGALDKGVPLDTAENVFKQLEAFGSYSFPKSHAASFAVLVYRSAWLKVYHPLAFYTALLNHQPMGFWSPAVVLNDTKRHGIRVLPVDIRHSDYDCTVESGALRIGLRYVKGIGEEHGQQLVAKRPYRNLADLMRRTDVPRRALENLILCGALDHWKIPRRKLLWQLGTTDNSDAPIRVETGLSPDLPELGGMDAAAITYALLGLAVDAHPISAYRDWLDQRGILDSAALLVCDNGRTVQSAGMLVMRQAPPTANGVRFLTLEDERGFINVILYPYVYEKYQQIIRKSRFLIISGKVQQVDDVTNLVAQRVLSSVT